MHFKNFTVKRVYRSIVDEAREERVGLRVDEKFSCNLATDIGKRKKWWQ
jgi:hypothetical protein